MPFSNILCRVGHDTPPELFINQLTPSSLHWKPGQLNLNLEAAPFAPDNVFRSNITFKSTVEPSNGGTASILRVRVPMWALPGQSSIKLCHEGKVLHYDQDVSPGDYVSLRRVFKSGTFSFPAETY